MLRYEAYANLAIRVTHFVSPIRGGKQNTPSITYAVPMAEPHMKPEQNVRKRVTNIKGVKTLSIERI